MQFTLKLKQFSPYICENAEFDSGSFDACQKRQLMSPIDLSLSHQQFMRFEASELPIPRARFRVSKLYEIIIPRSLCKLTFSDMLIIQGALSKISDSSAAYEKYMAASASQGEEGRLTTVSDDSSVRSARLQSTYGRDQMQQTFASVAGVLSGQNAMSNASFAAYQSFAFDGASRRRSSGTDGLLLQRYREARGSDASGGSDLFVTEDRPRTVMRDADELEPDGETPQPEEKREESSDTSEGQEE